MGTQSPCLSCTGLLPALAPSFRTSPKAVSHGLGLSFLFWKPLSRHIAQLKKKTTNTSKCVPLVFMKLSPGGASGDLPTPCRAWELTHLDELYPFILDTANLSLWEQEAAI